MNKLFAVLALLATTALAACGGGENSADSNTPAENSAQSQTGGDASSQAAGETYSGEGDITAISSDKVTISHGPIEGIGWPAMTMPFSVSSAELLQGLNVGDPVRFQFQKAGSDYVVTSINK